ncbi:hypothetical protein SAY86_012977 [Trapa natans]|uniref:Uncharacterized protein n=1 Tax=Trapa natans TaxID=22666 RepID=A0AAN7LT16_TRANT|nr:hypothetical protein SAY86_012977 [Trapa natans]
MLAWLTVSLPSSVLSESTAPFVQVCRLLPSSRCLQLCGPEKYKLVVLFEGMKGEKRVVKDGEEEGGRNPSEGRSEERVEGGEEEGDFDDEGEPKDAYLDIQEEDNDCAKLQEGFYEIEGVRRKRIRKVFQYSFC